MAKKSRYKTIGLISLISHATFLDYLVIVVQSDAIAASSSALNKRRYP
ncbi:hypothetical protein [Chloroherpeton thalassium]|nr:hypothetical protein [Chloroherpeton thalassium]